MRALIFELRPKALETEGLLAALNRQIDVLRAKQGFSAQLIAHAEPELAIEVKQALCRIAQEALWNAVKHARPRQVDVRLEAHEDSVDLEIADDGGGFGRVPSGAAESSAEKAYVLRSATNPPTRVEASTPAAGGQRSAQAERPAARVWTSGRSPLVLDPPSSLDHAGQAGSAIRPAVPAMNGSRRLLMVSGKAIVAKARMWQEVGIPFGCAQFGDTIGARHRPDPGARLRRCTAPRLGPDAGR